MLVDAQYNQRQDNRMKRLVKTASLDQPDASVMNIDYHSGRNLNRRMIQKLSTCEYIVDSLNIFITGATGSGKTYLACALAMEALKQYITVKYVRLSDFLLECNVAWDEKRYDKVLQTYAKPKLLIIDEWLAMTPDANDLHAIKELIHRRRRKSSTIFCSQILKEKAGIRPWEERTLRRKQSLTVSPMTATTSTSNTPIRQKQYRCGRCTTI
jgi:DNA replication protein DnaC